MKSEHKYMTVEQMAIVMQSLKEARQDAGLVIYIATKLVEHNLLVAGRRAQSGIDVAITILEGLK